MKRMLISEDEKSRILNLHQNLGYKTSLNEQVVPPQPVAKPAAKPVAKPAAKPVAKPVDGITKPGIALLLKTFDERGSTAVMDPKSPNTAWVGLNDVSPDGDPILGQITSYTVFPGEQNSYNLPYILSISYINAKDGYRTTDYYPIDGWQTDYQKSEKNISAQLQYGLNGISNNREIFQKLMNVGIQNTKDKQNMSSVVANGGKIGKIQLPDFYIQALKQGGIA